MSELKPCPFCGGPGSVEMDGCLWWVACDVCDGAAPMAVSEENAIALWNRRAPGWQLPVIEPRRLRCWNRRAPGWQPVETAPKDGTIYLGWRKDWSFPLGMMFCRYNEGLEQHQASNYLPYGEPTHWMPLPEAPSDG